jgi:hypothetical protein
MIELDDLERLTLPLDIASGDAVDRAYAALEVVVQATDNWQSTGDERDALAIAAARQIERVT